jgi:hypothetical protein
MSSISSRVQHACILRKCVASKLVNITTRDSGFQYDSTLGTELGRKWISVFRTRVREQLYESKVVKLISIHPVLYHYSDPETKL